MEDGAWPPELCKRLGISGPPAWSKALPKKRGSKILEGWNNLGNTLEVEQLFDGYADEFDNHLVHQLEYDIPAKLLARVPGRIDRCLDLGCGTGLVGKVFRPKCDYLAGADLSAEMIAKAKEPLDGPTPCSREIPRTANRGCYDDLHCRELVVHLKRQGDSSFDALVAADVLMYLPPSSIASMFAEALRVLRPGGAFYFSSEEASEMEAPDGCTKRLDTDRYAHTPAFILSLAQGFQASLVEDVVVRMESEVDVHGHVFVLHRPVQG